MKAQTKEISSKEIKNKKENKEKSGQLKKTITTIFLVLWFVFSVVYIAVDSWNNFKNFKLKAAYQQGLAESINTIIKESEKCSPISLYNNDKQIQIISLACLQQDNNQQQQEE